MNILARALRFFFWLLILVWGARVVRRLAGWLLYGGAAEIPPNENSVPSANVSSESRRLVQDPVCGMRLAEALAVPLREKGELIYFCSAECRDKYLNTGNKSAAASA